MTEPRDHDQGADPRGRIVQLPGHLVRLGHLGEVPLQPEELGTRRHGEVHPHEEPPVRGFPVLLAGHDVGRVLDQEAGDRVHDTRLFRTRQREHVLLTPRGTHG